MTTRPDDTTTTQRDPADALPALPECSAYLVVHYAASGRYRSAEIDVRGDGVFLRASGQDGEIAIDPSVLRNVLRAMAALPPA